MITDQSYHSVRKTEKERNRKGKGILNFNNLVEANCSTRSFYIILKYMHFAEIRIHLLANLKKHFSSP